MSASSSIFESFKLPIPNPSTVRKMRSLRFSSMSCSSSPSLDAPTLKSPSVARITRLLPPSMKFSLAMRYASLIPAPPAVEPPASRPSIAERIAPLLPPEVDGSTRPAFPA